MDIIQGSSREIFKSFPKLVVEKERTNPRSVIDLLVDLENHFKMFFFFCLKGCIDVFFGKL